MRVIAIIPARGGSKGVPRKNLALLGGKPLLVYSIEAALTTVAIERVIVSTDGADIAKVAQEYGAEVIWRPSELSGDEAVSETALLHVLDALRDKEQYEPDLVIFLQATSPLRRPDDIQNALGVFLQEQADSLFSACVFEGFVWERQADRLISLTYDFRNRRLRQHRNEHFKENGSIYMFKPSILRQHNNRLGGKIAVYAMDVLDSFQVDTPKDLELLEFLLEKRTKWLEKNGRRTEKNI